MLSKYAFTPLNFTRCSSSVAYKIREHFEAAYAHTDPQKYRRKAKSDTREEHKTDYYDRYKRKIKTGYVHPYHSEEFPIVFNYSDFFKFKSLAFGKEQVSPHYESLARSRRPIVVLATYVLAVGLISVIGGVHYNEWLYNMLSTHIFYFGLYLHVVELRHFSWFPLFRFSNFYNIYSKHEADQLMHQWMDCCEEAQREHMKYPGVQIEYARIVDEYSHIKLRGIIKYLTNQKLLVEKHFHDRSKNMLQLISDYEERNLKNYLRKLIEEALEETITAVQEDKDGNYREASLEQALGGIRDGVMTYQNTDMFLIQLLAAMEKRSIKYRELTEEKQSEILSLSLDQKRAISENDKRAKMDYLLKPPAMTNQGVRANPKYKEFIENLPEIAQMKYTQAQAKHNQIIILTG